MINIQTAQVGIIGVGNMGEALLTALLKAGAEPNRINFAVRRAERSAEISAKYGIAAATIEVMARQSDVLMIVVKPQDLETIMTRLKPTLNPEALIISFLAGKKISTLETGLGDPAVARVMPNTPTLLGAGMSIISYGGRVRDDQKRYVEQFLQVAGKSIEVDESLQDAAAATSGSGPAYFFAFVEAMVSGAVGMGLDQEIATQLVVQTIVGAAKMLDESGKSATTLRENVTSPKGMTYDIVARAMKAAADRSREMA